MERISTRCLGTSEWPSKLDRGDEWDMRTWQCPVFEVCTLMLYFPGQMRLWSMLFWHPYGVNCQVNYYG